MVTYELRWAMCWSDKGLQRLPIEKGTSACRFMEAAKLGSKIRM